MLGLTHLIVCRLVIVIVTINMFPNLGVVKYKSLSTDVINVHSLLGTHYNMGEQFAVRFVGRLVGT